MCNNHQVPKHAIVGPRCLHRIRFGNCNSMGLLFEEALSPHSMIGWRCFPRVSGEHGAGNTPLFRTADKSVNLVSNGHLLCQGTQATGGRGSSGLHNSEMNSKV